MQDFLTGRNDAWSYHLIQFFNQETRDNLPDSNEQFTIQVTTGVPTSHEESEADITTRRAVCCSCGSSKEEL